MSFGTVREILYFLVMIGLIVFIFINERDIIIKSPAVQGSTVILKPVYRVFELPRHETHAINIYLDTLDNQHQVYKDVVNIKSDSSEISWITNVDINVNSMAAIFDYDSVKTMCLEKIITNNIIDTVLVQKLVYQPFYSNSWFWTWFATTILFLGTLTAAIFG